MSYQAWHAARQHAMQILENVATELPEEKEHFRKALEWNFGDAQWVNYWATK